MYKNKCKVHTIIMTTTIKLIILLNVLVGFHYIKMKVSSSSAAVYVWLSYLPYNYM